MVLEVFKMYQNRSKDPVTPQISTWRTLPRDKVPLVLIQSTRKVCSFTYFFFSSVTNFFLASISSMRLTLASCLHLKREGVSMLG